MTEELKPCPFCGGEAKCIEFYGLYHVICCNCHIAGKDCSTRESAVSAWNSRPIENELHKKIEKLEAENTRLREALELIAKSNFYFARGEEDKQLSRVCEIARNALNGNEK